MTAAEIVSRRVLALRYDTTNSADIVDMMNTCSIANTTFTDYATAGQDPFQPVRWVSGNPVQTYTCYNGWWMIFCPDTAQVLCIPDAQFQAGYRHLAQQQADLGLDVVAAQAAAAAKPFGLGFIPGLALNAQTTLQVRMYPATPNASYTPLVEIIGTSAILAGLSVLSATVINSGRVDVVVKNTGLVTFAGTNVRVDFQ